MANFHAADGVALTVHELGVGDPIICLPGGPMKASAYLADLGGLSQRRTLQLLDLRGTGDSPPPTDAASYRVDRQVDDLEALRSHLGLERMDLLAHSAGAALALLYAVRYSDRLRRLVLVCPTPRVVGIEVSDEDRRETAKLRSNEPWYHDAYSAFERIWSGHSTDDDWDAIEPFMNGRWDAAQQAQVAREASLTNAAAAAEYYAPGAIDPDAVSSAIPHLNVTVLLIAGELDVALPPKPAAAYASLFPRSEFVIMPNAGHSPWQDDPRGFVDTVARFLS
jgi:pimeloyl-ACP methyl ester carboxylesterase